MDQKKKSRMKTHRDLFPAPPSASFTPTGVGRQRVFLYVAQEMPEGLFLLSFSLKSSSVYGGNSSIFHSSGTYDMELPSSLSTFSSCFFGAASHQPQSLPVLWALMGLGIRNEDFPLRTVSFSSLDFPLHLKYGMSYHGIW